MTSAAPQYDAYLVKLGSDGAQVFAKTLGVSHKETYGWGAATDSGGNVYMTGYTSALLIAGRATPISIDYYLAKYDRNGNKLWVAQDGGSMPTMGQSVAVDKDGNVWVAGFTQAGLDGNKLTGGMDFFVAKYDASGKKLFTRQVGAAGTSVMVRTLAVDVRGDVYVGGTVSGALPLNTAVGKSDLFVGKFSSSGALVYLRQFGAAGALAEGMGIAVDENGCAYLVGYTDKPIGGQAQIGKLDAVLLKVDATGVAAFTRQLGVSGFETGAYGVKLDAKGNIFLAGTTQGGLDGYTVTGKYDFFLAKYDAAGDRL